MVRHPTSGQQPYYKRISTLRRRRRSIAIKRTLHVVIPFIARTAEYAATIAEMKTTNE
jgi:hypothetical protein